MNYSRKTVAKRVQRILEVAKTIADGGEQQSRLEEMQVFSRYAEPGYTDPDCGIILTGNWNDVGPDNSGGKRGLIFRVGNLLNQLGCELEWCDEWVSCDQCNKLLRCSPDSYGWLQSYYELEGEFLCPECVDPEEVLRDLEGKHHTGLTLEIDPTEHGYVQANQESYQNGLYGAQNDSPEKIADQLSFLGIGRFFFKIDSTGQFDTDFSVFVHESQAHLLGDTEPVGKADVDPADALREGLAAAAEQARDLRGNGIVYSEIGSDGTARTRLVSPEEFVRGIGKGDA